MLEWVNARECSFSEKSRADFQGIALCLSRNPGAIHFRDLASLTGVA